MTANSAHLERSVAIASNRFVLRLSKHWLLLFLIGWGLFVFAPWLAPAFEHLGLSGAADAIYLIYSTQCHQLPERSFFLFGQKVMYSLEEIRAVWPATDLVGLRQFVGNEAMGWKVAWSDRMVAMWTSLWFGGVLFALFRRWLKPLPMWLYVVMILPMAIDGTTHFLSDVTGPAFGMGFRDTNAWLAALTNSQWPITFYAGDALGSFNSWMRLITGAIFGLGSAWLSLPYLDEFFGEAGREIEAKFARAGI